MLCHRSKLSVSVEYVSFKFKFSDSHFFTTVPFSVTRTHVILYSNCMNS